MMPFKTSAIGALLELGPSKSHCSDFRLRVALMRGHMTVNPAATGEYIQFFHYESEPTSLSVSKIVSVNLSLKSQQLKLISVLTPSRQRRGQFTVAGR